MLQLEILRLQFPGQQTPPRLCHRASPPIWLPASALPTGLDECFFNSLFFLAFHAACYSASSGCSLFLNWLSSFFWLYEGVKLSEWNLGWNSQNPRMKELLPFVTAWMELETPMLSEMSVGERQIPYYFTYKRDLTNKGIQPES